MAETDEWLVVEDGCLSVGTAVHDVTYHSTLNSILVSTAEPALKVLDVTSGSVLQSSDLSANKSDVISCIYLPGHDKVVFSDGRAVGVRHDLNGILLLDTALQTPIERTEDIVKVELPLPDASHLFKCLMGAELSGVDCVEDVIRELEKEIEIVQSATKANHKVAKWATVCLKLPHCALKTVCSSLVQEFKKLHQDVSGLPVASAIADRMSYLLPPLPGGQHGSCHIPVDRALMYSEAARRETFAKWPHMNYRWALPEAMSQAGFYHQPGSAGDDRAMCFTCNVCLVCWEPTDEPWSEHERHSPTCPFVKGEHTQNVPMEVTYATEPAVYHDSNGSLQKIECISQTSCDDLFATSSIHGSVVVWDVSGQLKKHIQFNIDPLDPVINLKTGAHSLPSESHVKKSEPKQAWVKKKKVPTATLR